MSHPFKMFINQISGKDITGNSDGGNRNLLKGFASTPTRNASLNPMAGGDISADYFGSPEDYDFAVPINDDALPRDMRPVDFLKSRLDLSYDLPSTRYVSRYNAQTGK